MRCFAGVYEPKDIEMGFSFDYSAVATALQLIELLPCMPAVKNSLRVCHDRRLSRYPRLAKSVALSVT